MTSAKCLGFLAVGLFVAVAAARVAVAQYEPPAGYYSSATGTGTTLENNLHHIIDNHVSRSYDAARQALQLLDQDPNDPTHIILVYNGQSVIGTWDAGVTWNREHQWPRSRGVDTSGPDTSDLFNLRSCNPSLNSSRGNEPYGTGSSSYWDPAALAAPGTNDRGDCSRAMFYMATRYDGSDANTVDLELVDGFPGTNQMGDLAKLLEWHYSDPVNDTERRRNHLIYSSADNPAYYQGNRNPFIDRPEFAWAIWGPYPNDSTIYVGSTVPGDGTSSVDVDLGRVIVGSALSVQNVTLHKIGTAPTTYDVTASGDFATTAAGQGRAFVGGTQSRAITVQPVGGTAIAGVRSGTVTIDNTDLTSGGAGDGSADGNDTINVSAEVVAHAEASFDGSVNEDAASADFGAVDVGTGEHVLAFSIYNLEGDSGFTADLDLDAVNCSGDTDVLTTDLAPTAGIAGGTSQSFTATLDGSAEVGTYEVTCTIAVSDENIPGAQSGTPLTLTLTGEVAGLQVPAASTWGLVTLALFLLIAATVVASRRQIVV